MKKVVLVFSILLCAMSCNKEQEPHLSAAVSAEHTRSASKHSFSSSIRSENGTVSESQNIGIERKRIKTGSITFETKALAVTKKKIITALTDTEGYVSRDNQYKSEERISMTLTVRVPAENFDALLEEISKGVAIFDAKNIHISDVTEQFLDTESRLKTKKALEITYLRILKKARTVREILDVERELANVRGAIEVAQGRIKYLQSQVSFSTLNITFYRKIKGTDIGFSSTLQEAFKEGFVKIKVFLVSLIAFWPFIILIIVVSFFLRNKIKKIKP
jgi:hypothetical protein